MDEEPDYGQQQNDEEMRQMEEHVTPAVYKAISDVTAALAKTGIGKDQKNEQQHYKFRGIDDVYNSLAPLLAQYGLCVLPRVLSRIVTERQTKSGSVLFSVALDVEFDFVAASDGSSHVVRVAGEAMDSGDKATNKAMSAAYKYACLQAFCIPTEGDNDADATTHPPIQAKIDPRPDTSEVDGVLVEKYVNRFADVLNQDIGENEIATDVYGIHLELASTEALYVAVADKLAADKIIGKAGLRKYIAQGKPSTMNATGRLA